MNLQLYQWGLVCTEGLQTSFVYLYLLVLFTFCTNLISGLQEHNILLQNPSPGCQEPAACNRHYLQPPSLCLTTSSHVKFVGCRYAHGLLP